MAPANQVLIVTPPRAHLVRVVTYQSGCAVLCDRLPVASRRRGVAEDQLAAHVLAIVVAPIGSPADVDELHGHVGALAVVGDSEPGVVVRHDTAWLWPHFVEGAP